MVFFFFFCQGKGFEAAVVDCKEISVNLKVKFSAQFDNGGQRTSLSYIPAGMFLASTLYVF